MAPQVFEDPWVQLQRITAERDELQLQVTRLQREANAELNRRRAADAKVKAMRFRKDAVAIGIFELHDRAISVLNAIQRVSDRWPGLDGGGRNRDEWAEFTMDNLAGALSLIKAWAEANHEGIVGGIAAVAREALDGIDVRHRLK